MNQNKLAAWAGMIGPILFVGIFTLEGWLRPGYNSLSMFVSQLSLSPRGWIQTLNFIVLGILFLIFARGIAAEFKEGKASRIGPLLFTIIGLAFLFSGSFVMDPAPTPTNLLSWHGWLHNIFGAFVFGLAPVSCFIFFRRFRVDPKWQSLQWWTLIAGVIITIAVIFLKAGQLGTGGLHDVIGLIQRVALITYLFWIFTFALILHRQR